jgi:hypothetical protein
VSLDAAAALRPLEAGDPGLEEVESLRRAFECELDELVLERGSSLTCRCC